MERREFFSAVGTAAVGAVAVASATEVFAQSTETQSMHPPKFKSLEESAGKCVATGDDCLRHCLGMLSMKDTTMAGCTTSVTELLAACRALQTLASVNSAFTPDFAKVTAKVCSACEKECRKFYDKYAECKACADACKQCGEDCSKVAALFNL